MALKKDLLRFAAENPELQEHVDAIVDALPKTAKRRMHCVNIVTAIKNVFDLQWNQIGFEEKPANFRNNIKRRGISSFEFDNDFEQLRLTVERIGIRKSDDE